MKQSAVEWLVKELQEADYIPKDSLILKYVIEQAEEIEKQQRQKTIEEVFEWLTKNNYVTDLKETLIEQYKNQ